MTAIFTNIQGLDFTILNFLQSLHTPLLNKFMIFCTRLGSWGALWVVLSLLLMTQKKYRWYGIAALTALLLGTILNEGILKPLIARPRPFLQIPPPHKMLIHKPHSFSCPSGHAMNSFATLPIWFKVNKKLGLGLLILALAIAISRPYLYVHFPSDITLGALVGLYCGFLALHLYQKNGRLPKDL